MKTTKQNSNFIDVTYYYTDDHGDFYGVCSDYSTFGAIKIKSTINTKYIVEITVPEKNTFTVREHTLHDWNYVVLTMFNVYLSDGRKLYLEESEYQKFYNLINKNNE